MQTKIGYLSDLKFNVETWIRELRFHFDEMDTFQEKLEEIASREFSHDARKNVEVFQNRIMIEKAAIAKLKHRCKDKITEIDHSEANASLDGELRRRHIGLKEDMRNYIKLHYDLKEEMMNFFAEYLEN
jgi:hypothetical protein